MMFSLRSAFAGLRLGATVAIPRIAHTPRTPMAIPTVAAPCMQIIRGMANKRHKKMIKLAKGYRGRANRCFTVAIQRVTKARQYAYRDRKVKKRDFRKLWIQRINAASRMYGFSYSLLIRNLNWSNIGLNRKILADLAVTEPLSFKSVVEVAKLAKNKL